MTVSQQQPPEALDGIVDIPAMTTPHSFDWLRSATGLRWKIWDFLVGWFAFYLGFLASPYTQKMPASYYLLLVGGLHGLTLMFAVRLCGVPNPEQRSDTYELVSHGVIATGLAFVVFSLIVWFFLVRTYGRYIVFSMEAVSLAGITAPRWVVRKIIELNPLRILIYGAGSTGRRLLDRLHREPGFQVVGFLDQNPDKRGAVIQGARVLGPIQDVSPRAMEALGVDVVVVCVGNRLKNENASRLLELPIRGIEVLNNGAFLEVFFKEVSMDYHNPHWFVSAPTVPANPSIFAAKRITSLVFSLAGLIATLPAWAVIALLIKLDSPGPVFFRQRRVGRFGRVFTIFKFRTMRVDAEKDGPQWAKENDPRVTRIGRILRKTRLDELPQLWNVVRGEMALVGPRPERPEFVEDLARELPIYNLRHIVPPGLTGWAQIRYHYGASKEDAKRKLEYDLYYIRHISLRFDFEIILRTLPLLMRGSR